LLLPVYHHDHAGLTPPLQFVDEPESLSQEGALPKDGRKKCDDEEDPEKLGKDRAYVFHTPSPMFRKQDFPKDCSKRLLSSIPAEIGGRIMTSRQPVF